MSTNLHFNLKDTNALIAFPPALQAQRTRCEVWTRVMGYHRPVASWNPGKQSEHQERRYFQAPSA